MSSRPTRRLALSSALVAVLMASSALSQSPAPSPSPSPTPAPIREVVEQEAEKIVQKEVREGVPRFEEQIEVFGKTPQMMLERFFGGAEVECGSLPGGVPSATDMRDARPMPGEALNFVEAAQQLLRAIKGEDKGPPRYFLYRVRKEKEARYELREGKIPVT